MKKETTVEHTQKSNYWGHRELTEQELMLVGGGVQQHGTEPGVSGREAPSDIPGKEVAISTIGIRG